MEIWVTNSGYCRGCEGGSCFLAPTFNCSFTDGSLVLASPLVQNQLESMNFTETRVLHQHNSHVSGCNYNCLQFWVNAVLTTLWRLYHCPITYQLKQLNLQWKPTSGEPFTQFCCSVTFCADMTNHHLSKAPLRFISLSNPRTLSCAHWHWRVASRAHTASWPIWTCVREVRARV